jgi:hypothetical protein
MLAKQAIVVTSANYFAFLSDRRYHRFTLPPACSLQLGEQFLPGGPEIPLSAPLASGGDIRGERREQGIHRPCGAPG